MLRREEWKHSKCPLCDRENKNGEHMLECTPLQPTKAWQDVQPQAILRLETIGTSPSIIRVIKYFWPPNTNSTDNIPTQFNNDERYLWQRQLCIGFINLFRGRILKD